MKTKLVLERRAFVSYAYLIIAIVLVLITVTPCEYTKEVYFISFRNIATGFREGYTVKEPNLGALGLWVMAVVYLVHFVYGAFHYPEKYRRVLNGCYVEPETDESNDYSGLRGILASVFTLIIIYLSYQYTTVGQELKYYFWAGCLPWFVLNCSLAYFSSTSSLFERSSVLINLDTILQNESSEHGYLHIFFDYPAVEDEKIWGEKVISAFTKLLNEQSMLETQERINADKISEKSVLKNS